MPDGKSPSPVAGVPLSPFAAASQINTLVNPSVLIVGAGIGGITLALDLDERGLTNWLIIDREDDVGGTWYVNRYPGCRCDVPAVLYSHSRFQNAQWTETHPDHREIQQYWKNIVKTQGLANRLRLSHDYLRADWDAEHNLYHVTLYDKVNNREVVLDCQVLVCATGAFAEPNRIPLEGEEDFTGRVIHAARWPKDLPFEDLRGKDVVVVGNGCSGVQIVGTLGLDPEIRLVSLARAQQWFMPSINGGPSAARNSAPNSERLRAIRSRFPWIQRMHRLIGLAITDSHFYWQYEKEGARARKQIEKRLGAWMVSRAPEHLKDKIIPDFPFMAKRYIFEDGYFAAINQPQNKAVYGRIAGLTKDGVKVDDGSVIPADVVVLSTGYAADHIDMQVAGESDTTANYKGKGDLTYYHGMTLPGMPNFYTLSGNNTLVNHSSVTLVLEIQAAYVTKMIEAMRDHNIAKLEVKREAAEKYDKWIEQQLERTTWPRVNNYWRKEGNGRIFTHYPGSILKMWWNSSAPEWADYKGADKLAVRQRVRRIVLTLVLIVGAALGGKKAWDAGLVHSLGARILAFAASIAATGSAAKDRVIGLIGK